jgi:hypothetical protein
MIPNKILIPFECVEVNWTVLSLVGFCWGAQAYPNLPLFRSLIQAQTCIEVD